MANGRLFNMHASTAASRTLDLGSRVTIENLANERVETVTITDRGPYVAGRIIDLSDGTARRLGFHEDGLARVEICPE